VNDHRDGRGDRRPLPAETRLESQPNRSLWIADNKGLPITKVVATSFPVVGHTIDKRVRRTQIPSERTLIVRGLKKNMILMSVRGLKRDGVNAYTNDDNSINTSDCLYITKEKIIVPFIKSNHAYNLALDNGSSQDGAALSTDHATRPNRVRPTVDVHSGIGHIGKRRMAESNLTMDGVLLKNITADHDETSCKGCRLGNTGKLFTKHARSSTAPHGNSTAGFTHFGQQMDSDICTSFPASFPHHFTAMWSTSLIDTGTRPSCTFSELSQLTKSLPQAVL
jgi:hypothetical protein